MGRLLGVVVVLAALAAAPAASSAPAVRAADCRPTPTDSFGPFGRGMPPLRSKTGTGHVLTGTILSALGCKPVRGARVEFWQSDKDGTYTRKLSGTVITNSAGRFRYESPYPAAAEPHMHIRVVAPNFRVLLTRFEPAPGEHVGNVRLVLVPADL
jgi:protocatechuate 3,4-dioxygenase beta subunit